MARCGWYWVCFDNLLICGTISGMAKLNNDKHERFCHEYLVDYNATQAAIRCGYSADTAAQQASRLLSDVKIRARTDELMEQMNREIVHGAKVTKERVIQEMARMALFDPRKLYDVHGNALRPHELDDDTAAAVTSFTKKWSKHGVDEEYKVNPKGAMVKALGEYFNIFEDHQKAGSGEIHVHISEKDQQL